MTDTSKLELIRRLIELAADERGNEHERASAQRQAEALMTKYAVEEWQLNQLREAGSARPQPEIKRGIYICPVSHHCAFAIAQLAAGLGTHLNVRVTFSGLGLKVKDTATWAKDWSVTATAVGFPGDLRMWEMVFTVIHMQMLSQIDPQVNTAETFDANVHRLHSAGVRWEEIARRMNAAGGNWEPVKWPDGGRLKRACRREAARLGQEYVVKSNPRGYQRSFAEAFMITVLRRFRDASKQERTSGSDLVLRDKYQAVLDFVKENMGEAKEVSDPRKTKLNMDGWVSGAMAGERADLNTASRVSNSDQPKGELA